MKRAKDIVESQKKVGVVYMNSNVWIEGVHENEGNADIKLIESGERMKVPVERLKEDVDSWME